MAAPAAAIMEQEGRQRRRTDSDVAAAGMDPVGSTSHVQRTHHVRHRIKPLYLFEAWMRAWMVSGPRLVAKTLPSVHRIIGLGFMYIYLQVLALLWAFLLNAASSVALDVSGLAARHALDFSLYVSLVRAFATFYVVYGTFRVFARFGSNIGLIAWESLDDFPHACRVATEAAEAWPYFISVAFLPQFCLAATLVVAPVLCHTSGDGAGEAVPASPVLDPDIRQDAGFWGYGAGLQEQTRAFLCTRTPLLYLTSEYPKARHTLKLVLVVGLLQYFQILLHRFPDWRTELAGAPQNSEPSGEETQSGSLPLHTEPLPHTSASLNAAHATAAVQCNGKPGSVTAVSDGNAGHSSTLIGIQQRPEGAQGAAMHAPMEGEGRKGLKGGGKGVRLWVRLALHFGLMACMSVTAVWALQWVLVAIGGATPSWLRMILGPLERDFGLWVVVAWTVWLLVLALILCGNASSPSPAIFQLREVFQNLKASFVLSCCLFFTTTLLHPSMGFLDAQRELTVLTVVIPITYVVLYQVVDAAMRWTSWVGLALASIAAAVLSIVLCSYSNFGGPGTVAIMGLHIFGKLMTFFAAAREEEEEEEDHDLDDDMSEHEKDESSSGHVPVAPLNLDFLSLSQRGRRGTSPIPETRAYASAAVPVPVGERQGALTSPPLAPNPFSFPAAAEDSTSLQGQQDLPALGGTSDSPHWVEENSIAGLNGASSSSISGHRASCELMPESSSVTADSVAPAVLSVRSSAASSHERATSNGDHLPGDNRASASSDGNSSSSSSSSSTNISSPNEGDMGGPQQPSSPAVNAASVAASIAVLAVSGIHASQAVVARPPEPAGPAHDHGPKQQHQQGHQEPDTSGAHVELQVEEETRVHVAVEGPAPNALGNGLLWAERSKRSYSCNDALSPRHSRQPSRPALGSGAGKDSGIGRKASKSDVSSGSAGQAKAGWVVDMWTDSNAQFMYHGLVRLSLALLVLLFLFLAACQMLSLIQEQRGWYPSLIRMDTTEGQQLVVDHALIAKVSLRTTGKATVTQPRYATCGMLWAGLSLVDYALLAELSYFDPDDTTTPLQQVLDKFFPPDKAHGWGVGSNESPFRIIVPPPEYRQATHAQFVEVRSRKGNVSIVAVRGTDIGRLGDFIEDIKIWVEPVVFMLLSTLFPTIRIWPDSTASAVIEWLHETLQLFGLQSSTALQYYLPLLEYVTELVKDGREVTLTGHSLGGGLARIVGSLAKVPSITFSPPGIAQSYRKFQVAAGALGRAGLHHESVAVIPEHDFVPMIDTQVGLVQTVTCKASAKALQGACHLLEVTLCELIDHCGDNRGRFTGCEWEYNLGNLVPFFLDTLRARMSTWLAPGIALVLIIVALLIVPEGI